MKELLKSRYPVYLPKNKPFVEWLKRILKLKDRK